MNNDFLDGLRALSEAAFPKRCKNCGKIYDTADDFLRQTLATRRDHSGLKQSHDDDEIAIVEVYRNCMCGSTLMDFFSDRRDVSDAGEHRRKLFGDLQRQLEQKGMTAGEARAHILNLLRGAADAGPN